MATPANEMIPIEALERVRDRESLFAFLHEQLGWPVDPEDTFTYQGPLVSGETAARVEVSRLVPFTAQDLFVIMLAEFQTDFPPHRPARNPPRHPQRNAHPRRLPGERAGGSDLPLCNAGLPGDTFRPLPRAGRPTAEVECFWLGTRKCRRHPHAARGKSARDTIVEESVK